MRKKFDAIEVGESNGLSRVGLRRRDVAESRFGLTEVVADLRRRGPVALGNADPFRKPAWARAPQSAGRGRQTVARH